MTDKTLKPTDLNYLQTDYTTVKAIFIKDLAIFDIQHQSLTSILAEQKQDAFREYSYKADSRLNLVKGDLAIVHANNGLAIVQISHVDETPHIDPNVSFHYKWVIDKIDLDGFKARLDEEENLKQLIAKLNHVEQQKQLIERIEIASQKDSELAQLWQQLKNKS